MRLDRLITVEANSNVRDAIGGETNDTWTALFTNLPANVRPLSGKEYFSAQAMQLVPARTQVFTVRYDGSLRNTTQTRILYDGLTYYVKHIAPLGERRDQWLEIIAESVAQL